MKVSCAILFDPKIGISRYYGSDTNVIEHHSAPPYADECRNDAECHPALLNARQQCSLPWMPQLCGSESLGILRALAHNAAVCLLIQNFKLLTAPCSRIPISVVLCHRLTHLLWRTTFYEKVLAEQLLSSDPCCHSTSISYLKVLHCQDY